MLLEKFSFCSTIISVSIILEQFHTLANISRPKYILFSQNNIKKTFTNGALIEAAIDAVKINPSIVANFDESIRLLKL